MPTPRYEREIRSILANLPNFLNDGPGRRDDTPRPANVRGPRVVLRSWWARDAYLMAAMLILIARFGGPIFGRSGIHVLGLLACCLILFGVLVCLVSAFAQPPRPHMWRGNVITYPTPSVYDRFLGWWRRRSSGNGPRGRY
jgi:hypothetical protein